MPIYAILGATGKVGLATSTVLREAGMSVRAVVHDASKADRLRSIGCEVAVADVHDVESLTKAFGQADAVQIILPPNFKAEDPPAEMRKAIESLVDALGATRPKRVLLISDYGAHVSSDIGMPSIFNSFEKRLSQLDGHKVFLRSAEHMENWAPVVPAAQASGSLPSFRDPVDTPFPTISAPDVGLVAAKLLMLPIDSNATHIVHAEGPRRYSARDVAAVLGELLDRSIAVGQVPRPHWGAVLEQNMSSSLAELLIKTNDAQNRGGLIDVEQGSAEVRYGTTELKEALHVLLGS